MEVSNNTTASADVQTLHLYKNTKGFNYEIKIVQKTGETDEDMFKRLQAQQNRMLKEYETAI